MIEKVNPNPYESKEIEQPKEADSVTTIVKKMFQAAKNARTAYDKDWDKRYKFYKGDQHDGVKQPTMNIIRSTIQTMLPLLTDAKPGINITATEPNDFEFSKTLQKILESWWDKPEVSMQHTLIEVIMDQSIYDAGICKVYYDMNADNGMGDVRVKSIDPKNIYINPEAVDFDKDCTYVIEKQRLTISWLKKMFPEHSSKIKSDSAENKHFDTDSVVKYPIDTEASINNRPQINESDCRETVEVWECWMDSDEFESYEESNDIGGVTESTRLKYPNGKLVTYLPQQNLILQSVENPYKHGKKPYVRFVDAILPHSFWGEGEAECLMNAQININQVLCNIMAYLKLMANPVWFVGTDSGVPPESITNDIAMILRVKESNLQSIRRDIPPAMQAGIINLYDSLMRNAEIESGINDSSQGRRPAGITAASAIIALQEASQTRIRLKERNMQTSLTKMASMLVQLFMQFYSAPRVLRITGTNGRTEWSEFYFDNTDAGYSLNKKSYTINDDNSVVDGDYEQPIESKGIFDISIKSGTSQPMARAARSELAMQLRAKGEISRKQLLDTLEWPNTLEDDEELAKEKGEQPAPVVQ